MWQMVGVREVADRIWLVSFMDYDLGFFDEECGRVHRRGFSPAQTANTKTATRLGGRFRIGRCERIRTSDPFLPKEVRYQAALHTVNFKGAQLYQTE